MSYCRWSTDNFHCDVYCYEDVSGGWTTHVAASRYPDDGRPPALELALTDFAKYQQDTRDWNSIWPAIEMVPIGLPHDGETFNDPTLEAFLERLIMLRDAGYLVPSYVFDDVRAEIAEAAK